MVLGTHAWTTSSYGPVYTCRAGGEDLQGALLAAIDRLPRGIHRPSGEAPPARPKEAARLQGGTAAGGATVKEGSYVLIGNDLMQIIDGSPVSVLVKSGKGSEGIFAKHARIIRGMIPVRDALRDVLRAQMENQPWGAAQLRLRVAY